MISLHTVEDLAMYNAKCAWIYLLQQEPISSNSMNGAKGPNLSSLHYAYQGKKLWRTNASNQGGGAKDTAQESNAVKIGSS